uniref:Uncharacterized protein n=1 Tax=viral metagenome TaxID=1070528 RepID=A0A6C0M0R6_9ZZZZ
MDVMFKAGVALAANYAVHYGAIKLYDVACIPPSLWEVPMGLFVAASPMCSSLLSVASQTQNAYAAVLTTTVAHALTKKIF